MSVQHKNAPDQNNTILLQSCPNWVFEQVATFLALFDLKQLLWTCKEFYTRKKFLVAFVTAIHDNDDDDLSMFCTANNIAIFQSLIENRVFYNNKKLIKKLLLQLIQTNNAVLLKVLLSWCTTKKEIIVLWSHDEKFFDGIIQFALRYQKQHGVNLETVIEILYNNQSTIKNTQLCDNNCCVGKIACFDNLHCISCAARGPLLCETCVQNVKYCNICFQYTCYCCYGNIEYYQCNCCYEKCCSECSGICSGCCRIECSNCQKEEPWEYYRHCRVTGMTLLLFKIDVIVTISHEKKKKKKALWTKKTRKHY